MPRRPVGSLVPKRTIVFNGHKTSVSVETTFWEGLKAIAAAQGATISQLIAAIDSQRRERQHTNLSSAIRVFVLEYHRQQNWGGAVS